eukprot:CAMPEP_0184981342 /NCGR_PEP_ID=MMETSP1098-20130426/11106_1 /TAXON_ID=89044 /ORGANISM="Spumella elongata, Strain CCAP 955/1" /LENGTH=958 /DNA_ID=CAMNT_0027504899 /DNA_START=60 /DNA_END=2939 /DNA_ORIENTATION=-
MNNLFAGLSALAPGALNASSETPQDIPPAELMNLCMKMNKRMQAMEAKGRDLVKKRTMVLMERQKLLDMMKTVMPIPILPKDDSDLDFVAIEAAWAQFDVQRRTQVSDLEEKVAEKEQLMQKSLHAMEEQYKQIIADLRISQAKLSSSETSSPGDVSTGDEASELQRSEQLAELEAAQKRSIDAVIEAEKEKMLAQTAFNELQKRALKADTENERLKGVESYLKTQITTLEGVISAKNAEIENIQKEMETNKTTFEEKIVYLQMQLTSTKDQATSKDKESVNHKAVTDKLHAQIASLQRSIEEKDLSYNSNKDMIQALQSRLIEMEPELVANREKIAQHERHATAQAMLKAEQTALINSLRNDLKNNLDESEGARRRVKELEEFKVKAEGQLLKLNSLTEQVQEYKSVIEEKDSLITRIRNEMQVAERNHAMRTAMLATCEAQLETHAADLQAKDNTIAETIERVTSLQSSLAASESRLAERVAEFNAQVSALEERVQNVEKDRDVALSTLEKIHEEALDALKRDHAKKSAMARTLLSEREEEVRVLSTKNQELLEEINSGAPTERKIFELATSQAKRENMHGKHNDTREIAFNQLQAKLANKDLELAKAQQNLALLQNEVVELRRFSKRDGINMDYLKNIVIQYMTFPAQSSEKLSLVPVLATLLQFTPKELSSVQRCAVLEPAQTSLWSSIGLGGGSSVLSSKVPKEVKRPAVPIPAVSAPVVASNTTSSHGNSSHKMSSSTLTAAALAQLSNSSKNTYLTSSAGAVDKPQSGNNSKKIENDNAASEYQPPVLSPSSFPASPLSPSTSNSDVEGTYVPPSLQSLQYPAQASPSAPNKTGNNPPQNGVSNAPSSLMVEISPEEASQNQAGEPLSRRAGHRLGSNYKKSAHSIHRMTSANRSASMNSEMEFQQKLKSIGSDILSVSYDASYDDADVDATYVEVEDGIEEDDNEDGASV